MQVKYRVWIFSFLERVCIHGMYMPSFLSGPLLMRFIEAWQLSPKGSNQNHNNSSAPFERKKQSLGTELAL